MIKANKIIKQLSNPCPEINWIANEETGYWEPPVPKPDSGLWKWDINRWIEKEFADFNGLVCSYPRSGSTYLSHYLILAYELNDKKFFGNWHTVEKIESATDKVFVTIRNPKDSIASWANLQLNSSALDLDEINAESIKEDIKYYLRFMNAILANLEKVILFDFDKVISDIDYIDSVISNNTNLTKINNISDQQVKDLMVENNRAFNLPQDTDEGIEDIKSLVENSEKYQECVDIYNQIKGML